MRWQLSPDEKQLAFARTEKTGGSNIWVMELANGIAKRLTFDSRALDTGPVWSPDSKRIIFGRRGGLSEVIVSSGATTVVYDGETAPAPDTWSPDGSFLIYHDPNSRFASAITGREKGAAHS